MPAVVEDGTGISNANAYITDAFLAAYAIDAGVTLPAGSSDGARIRGTRWLDSQFRSQYPGQRLRGRAQGLEWPRTGATDSVGYAIPENEVPFEIRQAAAEAAIREMRSPNSLSPDVAPGTAGGTIKRVRKKVGPLEKEIEYSEAAAGGSGFPVIDALLGGLLGSDDQGGFAIMVV